MTERDWKVATAAAFMPKEGSKEAFIFACDEFSDGAYRLAAAAHAWGVKNQDTGDKFMQQAQDREWLKKRLEEVKR
jgi:hypothetical protein